MTDKIRVGNQEPKEVTKLNRELYLVGRQIFQSNQHMYHIGWSGLGKFVDWLEENYELVPKKKPNKIEHES